MAVVLGTAELFYQMKVTVWVLRIINVWRIQIYFSTTVKKKILIYVQIYSKIDSVKIEKTLPAWIRWKIKTCVSQIKIIYVWILKNSNFVVKTLIPSAENLKISMISTVQLRWIRLYFKKLWFVRVKRIIFVTMCLLINVFHPTQDCAKI